MIGFMTRGTHMRDFDLNAENQKKVDKIWPKIGGYKKPI